MVGRVAKGHRSSGDHGDKPRWVRWFGIGRRVLGRVLLVLAGLVLVLAAAFLLAPTRGALLGWGVGLAAKALPGHLEAGEVAWPSMDRLVLADVLWVAGSASAPGDTLADLSRLDLHLDLGALKHKDGRIDSVHLDLRLLDVPAIEEAFSDLGVESSTDTTAASAESASIPFFRPGSLPGIPSVSLAALDVKAGRVLLAPGVKAWDLVFEGQADMSRGRPATVRVDHLGSRFGTTVVDSAGATELEVALEHLGFGLALEFPDEAAGDWSLFVATLDSLNLEIAPNDNPSLPRIWQYSEPVSLRAGARVEKKGTEYAGHLASDFVLPGSAHFHPWLPDDFPHQEFGSVSGHLEVDGSYADPLVKGGLRLDLGSNTWLEYGVVAGTAEANLDTLRDKGPLGFTAQVDTLDIALDGIRIKSSGNWGYDDFEIGLTTRLTDLRLPGMFAFWVDPGLKEKWRDPGPVSLNLDANFGRVGQEYSGSLGGDFVLPGSSHFHPWLPEEFPHEEFDSLSGEFSLAGRYEDPLASGSVYLDLGSNTWLEEGLVSGSAEADIDSLMNDGLRHLAARLDNLNIDMEGVRMDASGEIGPEVLALALEGEVTDLSLADLFVDPDLAGAEIELRFDAGVGGSLDDPRIDAHLGGGVIHEGIRIPTFDFNLDGDRRNVAAFLVAAGGLEFQDTSLDSVRAEVQGEMAALDSLTASFGLAAWKQENRIALGGAVRGDSVRVVRLDSLVTVFFGQEMRIREPVTLTAGPEPGVFDLTKLEFAGPPGEVTARGFWNEEDMDLDAAVDLLLREAVLMELAPSTLWSSNGGLDLKLDAAAGLETVEGESLVEGQVGAVILPHRDEPPLGVQLDFVSRGGKEADLNADFMLSLADTTLLEAQLDWPGLAGPEMGFWRPDPDKDLTLTVPSQELDLARINSRLPAEVVLEGRFDVEAEVHVFPPRKGQAPVDSLAVIPLRGSLEGTLKGPDLRVELPNRSWVNLGVDVSFSGPLEDPKVVVKVDVPSGFIRIPEIPRNLHPVEGTSLLWALNDSLLAAMDSTASDSLGTGLAVDRSDSLVVFLPPDQIGPALEASKPMMLPEIDMEVVIARDLRIIGYGIDLKLGGRLQISRGFDEDNLPGPAVKGDLKVPEGTIKVMNRVFKVERGDIKFTGSVPANPNLDLMLETQVNAYLLRVNVSGRAEAPVIELTSEPDLGEEDIMAVLLFGQPMNDLDTDQRGRMDEENDPSRELQKNLAGLAMAFGTKGLQDSMNESLGVDMVQMGSDSSGGSTLMVGKFITPDIILKYNQSLEKTGTYFMTLEYSLNRYFKVVSTYGQGEEASGAELRWSRRY